MKKTLADAVEILPKIFVGNRHAAEDADFFSRHNVRAVLNVTATLPNTFRCDSQIEYLRIPVYDSEERRDVARMKQYLPVITEFIHKNVVIEKKVLLVHCVMGRQRSCAALVSYLIRFYDMSSLDAVEYVLARKPDAFHFGKTVNFARALNEYSETVDSAKV